MRRPHHSPRAMIGWALFAVMVALTSEALYRQGAFNRVDQRLQDYWFQWQGKRAEPNHVVIVAIDEETLAAYPDDPLVFWTDRLSKAITIIRQSGASVVGLDFLLSISPERWLGKLGGDLRDAARNYDQPFREELNRGKLILAATRAGDGSNESDYLLPSPDYLLALPDFDIPAFIGLADLHDEGDGVIRRFRVTPVSAERRAALENSVPSLGLPSLLAVVAAGQNPHAREWVLAGQTLSRDQPAAPIPYWGPPGTFTRISLQKILAPGAEKSPEVLALRGKVVVIGATATGMNDEHFTPYASRLLTDRSRLMPGVEIHANVIESLLTGSRLHPAGDVTRISALVFVAGAAVAVFVTAPAWLGVLSGMLALGLVWLVGYLVFLAGGLISVLTYGTAIGLALLGVFGSRLTGEERQRRHLRQMFGRYVSEQVVESLLKSGKHPELGGHSQMVTVLFSDIRNFTTISERLTAKEVVEMLNTYFEKSCEPILEEGGSIDKFIGDAIMVEFGSPLPVEDHALRAARAALAMQQVAGEFAIWMDTRFPGRDLPKFAIGIGLHSGEAIIGNIGSPTRMEFTAIGDTVNLASRLEGMTKEIGCVVLASEATVEQACGRIVCGKTDVVKVKGRDAPVRVFEVLDVNRETVHVEQ